MELEVVNDLIARHSRGQTFLAKGERFSTTDGEAQALLQRFPQFVRAVPTPAATTSRAIVYEPATKPDGSPLSAIYWESGDGRILGLLPLNSWPDQGINFGLSRPLRGKLAGSMRIDCARSGNGRGRSQS